MKYIIILLSIVCSSLASSFEFAWQSDLSTKESKTIEDYFNLLPSRFINCEGAQFGHYDSAEKRAKIIKHKDLKNGFLEFNRGSQIVLFKDRINKKDIIGIQSGKCGSGSNCPAINGFYTVENNQWIEINHVTPFKQSLTDAFYSDDICPYYDLPRYGLRVKLINELSEKSFREMTWKKDKFVFDE
ncbi:hypothetical protein CBF23_006115 [Marinomonas agarivorans]|nr:hypothetical protein CBF23_006115 [Marinomonas agarivorans]